jgi:hypothetical protein
LAFGASLLLVSTAIATAAVAQEPPLCGPPGEEVPATIVGAGVIIGTPGEDAIVGSNGDDRMLALSGDDVVWAEAGNDVVDGGPGDDTVAGDQLDLAPFIPSDGTNDDILRGGEGNDTLAGLGGDDRLEGGSGNDELIGMGGYDDIRGGSGADTALGGPLDDVISGGAGNDTLWGNFGSDDISGGSGNDVIHGDNPGPPPPNLPFPPGTNVDTCSGGSGSDAVDNCEIRTERVDTSRREEDAARPSVGRHSVSRTHRRPLARTGRSTGPLAAQGPAWSGYDPNRTTSRSNGSWAVRTDDGFAASNGRAPVVCSPTLSSHNRSVIRPSTVNESNAYGGLSAGK